MRPIFVILLLLASCASPAPQFFGSARQDVELGGMRFAVFVRQDEAQVIRLGYLPRRDRTRVPELMMRAAELASGCEAIPFSLKSRIPGDPGEGRVNLRCGP
ncbi:hypothetical protein RGQ15_00835 [Paracoccus sp. MBLB3053]|uniref:Lipoprotein n=1 Tax=Paracoccus aurantius TaxID=3073814 RepID=A0ABU2HM72_9RHOB|nr:hypothetical protein [Paracoccus sp. MBLB3053]MDS9466123.1 hypothetical protein [Paracoccus sp. MBLB3053]